MEIWAKYLKTFVISVKKWRPTWFDLKKNGTQRLQNHMKTFL